MKSYGQYCALARALDIIGDRWTPLVVRELLGGAHRYSELLEGLPGIATNLLADRLRSLEDQGVVERDGEGRYGLTAWGQGLSEPLYALARWGAPLMAGPMGDDAFRSDWLVHPVKVLFEGADRRRSRLTVEIRAGGSPVTIESAEGEVRLHPGPAQSPDLVLTGPADGIVGLLAGTLDAGAAAERGVSIEGDARRLAGLRPRGPVRSGPVVRRPASA